MDPEPRPVPPSAETYLFLASDGKTYEATFLEVREWYREGRVGPDDYLTLKSNKLEVRVRDIMPALVQSSPANRPKPPLTGGATTAPEINSHLTMAVISTVCVGCLPIGVVAIVYAVQVDGFVRRGDYVIAQEMADKANEWATWSIVIGIVEILLAIVLKLSR